MSYPVNLSLANCAKGPSAGGLPIAELRLLAEEMGINPKLTKAEICDEMAKILHKPEAGPKKLIKITKKATESTTASDSTTNIPIIKTPKKILITKSKPVIDKPVLTQPGIKATAVCVAVAKLRPRYQDLEEWMNDPQNLYVGRHGRIFITDPVTKERRIFHYPASKWANPYKVGKDYTLDESIAKYQEHLKTSGLLSQIRELEGKRLGCFCDQSEICHAQILADLANGDKMD